jgi:hypothetical protein
MFGWATAPRAANVGTGATAAAAAQRLTVMFASSTVMNPVPAAVPAETVASYTSALTASFASSAACLATCCLSAPAHIAPGTSLRPTTCTPVCSAQPPVANPWPAHRHRISEQRLVHECRASAQHSTPPALQLRQDLGLLQVPSQWPRPQPLPCSCVLVSVSQH